MYVSISLAVMILACIPGQVINSMLLDEYDQSEYYYDYPQQDEGEISTLAVRTNSSFIIPCPELVPVAASGTRTGSAAADATLAGGSHTVLYHRNIIVDIYGGNGDSDSIGARISKFGNNFHVRNAHPSDSGRWSCERTTNSISGGFNAVAGGGGTAVMLTDVIVSEPDKLTVFVMGEIVTTSVINIRRDFPVDIICSILGPPITGTPEGNIPLAWSRPGDLGWVPMTHTTDIYHSSGAVGPTAPSQYSSLVKVSSRDVINNNYDEISCHSDDKRVIFKVVEEFRPEFTISRSPGFGVPILEDMRVTLKCIVESNPPCLPIWEHNGVRVNTSVTHSDLPTSNWVQLTFEKISPADEGWYSCTTVHKFGNFSSVGYYLGVKPQAAVTAMGNGGNFGNNGNPLNGGATTASLISDQVMWIDSGGTGGGDNNNGNNGIGNDGSSEPHTGCPPDRRRNKAQDFSMPVITPEFKNIRAIEGETIRIEAEICANPEADRIFWSGPSPALLLTPGTNSTGHTLPATPPKYQALPLQSRRTDTMACSSSVLVLANASLADSGLYILVARNTYHITEARFELDVGSNLIKAAFSEDIKVINNHFANVVVENVKDITHQDPLISDNIILDDISVENSVENYKINFIFLLLLLLIVPRAF